MYQMNMARRIRQYDGQLVDKSTVIKCIDGQYYPPKMVVEVHTTNGVITESILNVGKTIVQSILNNKLYLKKECIEINDVSGLLYLHISQSINECNKIVESDKTIILVEQEKMFVTYRYAKKYFHESLKTGQFYKNAKELEEAEKGGFAKYQDFDNVKTLTDFENSKQAIMFGAQSPSFVNTDGIKRHFGVELETSGGVLPPHIHKNFNLKCEYDGSLKNDDGVAWGGEYVTGILHGDAGLYHLKQICDELAKRTEFNYKCGMHVHIEAPEKNSFPATMHRLGIGVEDALFNMLPPARARNQYCKKLTRYNEANKVVFDGCLPVDTQSIYTAFLYSDYLDNTPTSLKALKGMKGKPHPANDRAGYRRENPRYNWLNLLPCLFKRKLNVGYLGETSSGEARLNALAASIRRVTSAPPSLTNCREQLNRIANFQIDSGSFSRPVVEGVHSDANMTLLSNDPTSGSAVIYVVNPATDRTVYLNMFKTGQLLMVKHGNSMNLFLEVNTNIYWKFADIALGERNIFVRFTNSDTRPDYLNPYRHSGRSQEVSEAVNYYILTYSGRLGGFLQDYREEIVQHLNVYEMVRYIRPLGIVRHSIVMDNISAPHLEFVNYMYERYRNTFNSFPGTPFEEAVSEKPVKKSSLKLTCSPYTVEFRQHSPTTNYVKIYNWILICMGLVHFADLYEDEVWSREIGDITLEEVISRMYPKLKDSILEYIAQRTELFTEENWKKNVKNDIEITDGTTTSSVSIKNLSKLCV